MSTSDRGFQNKFIKLLAITTFSMGSVLQSPLSLADQKAQAEQKVKAEQKAQPEQIAQSGQKAQAEQKVLNWVGCGISKKAFMKELAIGFENKTGIKVILQGGGATRGIRDAAANKADIGGSCRFKLSNHKVEKDAVFEPVAWDALAVITHPKNPVKNITLDQIRGVYLGKITNWKTLGGNNAPIRLMIRKGKTSGVGHTIRRLVFANFNQNFVAKSKNTMKSSGPVEKAVMSDINAIGITGISSAKKRDVNILTLEDLTPSYENIRKGTYLLYRPLYLVMSKESKETKEVRDFIKFAHSSAGRKIIKKAGTVPYLEALVLVMREVEQEARANERGLYR
jgi:phosphate transport system substrate-binding protein